SFHARTSPASNLASRAPTGASRRHFRTGLAVTRTCEEQQLRVGPDLPTARPSPERLELEPSSEPLLLVREQHCDRLPLGVLKLDSHGVSVRQTFTRESRSFWACCEAVSRHEGMGAVSRSGHPLAPTPFAGHRVQVEAEDAHILSAYQPPPAADRTSRSALRCAHQPAIRAHG